MRVIGFARSGLKGLGIASGARDGIPKPPIHNALETPGKDPSPLRARRRGAAENLTIP